MSRGKWKRKPESSLNTEKTVADDVLGVTIPKPSLDEKSPCYIAFAILKKSEGSLYILRTMTIVDNQVVSIEDDEADLFAIKMGRMELAIEGMVQ